MLILTEFAYQKRHLLDEFRNKSEEYMLHMMYLYYLTDNSAINHWKQEIYNFYHDCGKLKGSNRKPYPKELYQAIWGERSDIFIENYEVYLDILNTEENVDIEYKPSDAISVYSFIDEYSKWLSNKLSVEKVAILRKEVYDKLDELLKKYK